MNITTQQVLRFFLSQLQHDASLNEGLHPFFEDFFTRSELCAILEQDYGSCVYQLGKEALAEKLRSSQVLYHYVQQWEQALQQQASLTDEAVQATLAQLGLRHHYLASKPIDLWDNYDQSNYRSLQRKAGNIQKVYGLFDRSVAPEQASCVTSPPNRYYDSFEQAQEAFEEKGCSLEEVHILSLYKAH